MNDAIQKFKELLERVKTVSIDTGSNASLEKNIVAAVLHQSLVRLGKSSTLTHFEDEKTKRFIEKLVGPIARTVTQEHMVIKLDTKSMPVSELKYEKEGDVFKIILQSNQTLDPRNLIVENEKTPVDLLMLIDPPEQEVEKSVQQTPHKEVIKVSSKERALALKIVEIVSFLFVAIPKDLSGALWYLLDHHEKETLDSSSFLIETKQKLIAAGADQKHIKEAESEFLGPSFWKLLGRALARSEFEKKIETVWSFLPHADFQKTGAPTSLALRIFEKLRAVRHEGNFVVLLWEENLATPESVPTPSKKKIISAIIGSSQRASLTALATAMGSHLSSSYFFVTGFETFSEAELAIRSHIQRIR